MAPTAQQADLEGQYSPSIQSTKILWRLATAEADIKSWPWYARVSSEGNPSDAPSRLDLDWLRSVGKIVVPVALDC
eukprot:11184802-Karenia_brevis.AAC.1